MKYYYRILNIRETATDDEIKRSYRMHAKLYHPDVCQDENSAGKFADVNEAYYVLSDPEKRAEYDRLLAEENEAKASPEKIIARRRPPRADGRQADASDFDDNYSRRQAEYAAKREAVRREAEARAEIIRDSIRKGIDPTYIIMRRQAAIIRAQEQEQARRFQSQLAAAEKRAHEMGVEVGKRAMIADLNVVSGQLKTAKNENARLQTKLNGILRDRQDLERELFNRDREFNEQKKKAAEFEKQVISLKNRPDERTELRAATAELKTVKNEYARLQTKLNAAINARQGLELELSNRSRAFAEQKQKAAELEKQVRTLKTRSAERSELTAANAELKNVNSELRAARAENEMLKKSVAAAQKSREDMEKRFAYVAELKAVAIKLRNRVATLESEQAANGGEVVGDAAELRAKITDAHKRVVTLERDNDELEQNLKRVREAYEKEHARAERERERAEQASKKAQELDNERKRLEEISQARNNESVSRINAKLEEEQKTKEELKKRLQQLSSDFESECERIRAEHDSDYGSEVEINKLTFSANAGDLEAQNALGEIYLYSKNVNHELAAHWFKEAAKKKHADAMYNLGICYINGAGVTKNVGTGMGFIRMAARLGSAKARKYRSTVKKSV